MRLLHQGCSDRRLTIIREFQELKIKKVGDGIMFKKLLLVSALFATTTGMSLASTPVPYVGASLGIVNNTSNNVGSKYGNHQGFYRGVPVNLFAGYGGVVNENFYIAGEVDATLGTGEINKGSSALKSTYGFGVSLIPGVMLSDHTLAYLRAGYERTRFTNLGNMASGGKFGVGLQTSVTQNVDVRGEYDFVAYRTVSGVKSPRSDNYTLGLVYKFD